MEAFWIWMLFEWTNSIPNRVEFLRVALPNTTMIAGAFFEPTVTPLITQLPVT